VGNDVAPHIRQTQRTQLIVPNAHHHDEQSIQAG
jgi:hypothetical protein